MFEFTFNEIIAISITLLLVGFIHIIMKYKNEKVIKDFTLLKSLQIIDKNNGFDNNDLIDNKISKYNLICKNLYIAAYISCFLTIIAFLCLSMLDARIDYFYYSLVFIYFSISCLYRFKIINNLILNLN
ncbi:hypothetical protein [Arcobacter sp.]|uniref:hypothetical protein n=1 Tax=unclassified Arcobacter TaxID=2593671 RepID=UPI003AFFE4C9